MIARRRLAAALRDAGPLLALLLLSAAIYRPWDAPHLPLTDFGLFFAARGEDKSFWSQYVQVASYYIGEGRFCLITYLYLVACGAIFDTWAAGWHWTYFLLNGAVLVLARDFFIRIGLNPASVFVALALWATMGPTAELWLRPAGEPIALIFFLIALRAGLNFATAANWRGRAFVIAACALGILLSKEILIVLLPAGWLVSRLSFQNDEWTWAPWSRRDTYLLLLVSGSLAIAIIPIIQVVSHASTASYAAEYSARAPKITRFLERLEVLLVPSAPRLHWLRLILNDPAWVLIRTLPNLLWITMVLSSLAVAKRRRVGWPAVVGVLWAGLGLLAYVPWPRDGMFYMMAFALGTAFIAAHAFHVPMSKGNQNRRATLALSAFLIVVASLEARNVLFQQRLRAELNGALIKAMASDSGAGVLIGAVPSPSGGTGGWASHLRGFGKAENGTQVASWADMSCDDARHALVSVPDAIVVSSAGGCGQLVDRSVIVSASVPSLRWPIIWRNGRSEGRMFLARSAVRPVEAPL